MNLDEMLRELDGYFARKEIAKVEPFLLDQLGRASAANDAPAGLTIMNELMGFYRGMSRYKESIVVADKALTLLEMMGYQGSVSYATTLLNVANAYRADGQTARAIAQFEEVMAIYKAHALDDPSLIASLYNNLSLACQEADDHEQAIAYLDMALPLVEGLGHIDMVASTFTNLASSKLKLGRLTEAKHDLEAAVRLFESQSITNSHFGAALAGLGEVAWHEGRHADAVAHYERALADIESHYGKNMYYAVTLENLATALAALDERKAATLRREATQIQTALRMNAGQGAAPSQRPDLPLETRLDPAIRTTPRTRIVPTAGLGMDLARHYYAASRTQLFGPGSPFAAYKDRIAVGLVGYGSECFGHDDTISQDHDFGAGFCLWLTGDDFAAIGPALQAAYDALPASFAGFAARRSQTGPSAPDAVNRGQRNAQRVGVFSISNFYSEFLGAPHLPISDADWLQIPEELLATAINGEVFEDPLGEFSRWRTTLMHEYPDSVRRKRIAGAVAKMAQSGQYNLARALLRGETTTALLAQAEFIRSACTLAYALNGQYAPFYKWLHRGLKQLPRLTGLHDSIALLAVTPADAARPIIETICAEVLNELIAQGYTTAGDTFLEAHVDAILEPAATQANTQASTP